MMIPMNWTKILSDGTNATKQQLVSVLASAPEFVLQTEFIRTFIDDFYDEQKKYLIWRGFIPFVIYLIGTLGYLTSTRDSLRHRDNDGFEIRFADIAFIGMLVSGTVYFTVLESKQMTTLKYQYL